MIASTPSKKPSLNLKKFSYKDVAKKIITPTRHEAIVLFENAKKRLNDINNWTLFCGNSPADFQLTDQDGNLIYSEIPKIGNIIKVRLNASSNHSGNGYLWYKIEKFIFDKNLLKDTEEFGFNTVQVSDPTNFSSQTASGITCLFLVTRSGSLVSALEVETTKISKKPLSIIKVLKNRFLSVIDSFSTPNRQWESLVNGVLQ